jgi:hypothetical protein
MTAKSGMTTEQYLAHLEHQIDQLREDVAAIVTQHNAIATGKIVL